MSETINIKQRFKSSIKRGTGEAYLLMQSHPDIDFSDTIIMASVKNFAYDGQCEGSRAPYLVRLILLSNQQEKIRAAILKALATEKDDTWTLVQLFDFAKMLAENGDDEARQAIYDRYYTNIIPGSDWIGYDEILELDGINGLLFIADKVGKALEKDPDDWQDGTIIGNLQQKVHDINIMEVLEEASINNRFIKIYLDSVKRTEASVIKRKSEAVAFKDVVEEVFSFKSRFQFLRRKFDDTELNLIAHRLLTEKNSVNLEKLLQVFVKNKFPLDSQVILDIAKRSSKYHSKIAGFAIEALALLSSASIREFALEQIRTHKNPERFTGILKSNYEKGDDKLLTDLVLKTKNEYKIEMLIADYTEIYTINETKECREPLEALYAKSTCSLHRKNIVDILLENNVLSDKIKAEIKFDSNEGIRQIAEQLQQSPVQKGN